MKEKGAEDIATDSDKAYIGECGFFLFLAGRWVTYF